jgi:hypothetical protein
MRKPPTRTFNPASVEHALFDAPEKKTSSDTRREIPQLLKRLRRKEGATGASIALAEKIDACSRRERCRSPACPVCARAAQRQYTQMLDDFLRAREARGNIYVVSIVPGDATMKPGDLSVAADKLAIRRVKHAMKMAGIRWFVGAWDWSRNEHRDGKFPPHWALHVHGFTRSPDGKMLRRRLKKRFPKTDEIARPVKVKSWDGNRRAAQYCLKPTFTRRISIESERFDRHAGKKTKCRNTDKQPLRSGEVRELLSHLEAMGIDGRIALIGVRIRNQSKGGASIELLTSKRRRHH